MSHRSILSGARYATFLNHVAPRRLPVVSAHPAIAPPALHRPFGCHPLRSIWSFHHVSSTEAASLLAPQTRPFINLNTSLSAQACRAYATRSLPSRSPLIVPSISPKHVFNRARRKKAIQVRNKTSVDDAQQSSEKSSTSSATKAGRTAAATGSAKGSAKIPNPTASPPTGQRENLLRRLPHLPQRFHAPTKEELLAAATGFWSRLRVRFKWFSIRSLRPFNMDDISAFFSWVLVGHVIWILLGTTTFFSLLILTLNTVFAQETIARWVGNYLTKSSGVKVIFESAIVPKWKNGVITFKNVFVSRRPGQTKSEVSKGSQTAAAAIAAELASERSVPENEDTNYTQYDLSIETINVTLSFAKWFNGRGLLRDVEVSGIRGVVDRTSVQWSGDDVDPRSFRHEYSPGDFEIDSFKLEDLLVSVYQPNDFRPFSVSIYSADLPQLRKQWLFYDFLSANHISGSFDESLFTIHPRQTHNYTGSQLNEGIEDGRADWKKYSRIRIDGLKIDHLNRGVEGPFSWIYEGNVDIVADIMVPSDSSQSISQFVADFYDKVEASVTSGRLSQSDRNLPSQEPKTIHNEPSPIHDTSESTEETKSSTQHPNSVQASTTSPDPRYLIIDLHLSLRSVRAFVPLFTSDLSYINSALIRPIVAYINSHSAPSLPSQHQPYIPISCRVVKPVSDFEGSWTIYDSCLMDDISRETYEAFAKGVVDEEKRARRIRKVGLWTVQLAIQALFLGLAGNMA